MTVPADILVVGAGPTGLALALQAHDHGASVRIVERREEFFRPSRAMMMHPRTLELLRPLGVTDALLARGNSSASVRLHLGPRVVVVPSARIDLPNTAFPHLLLIRQADVEDVLTQALETRGIKVERGLEVVDIRRDDAALAIVRHADQLESIPYRFLVGCDGADGLIRSYVGGWRGSWSRQEVVLADLELGDTTWLRDEAAHVVAGRHGLLFLFPIGELAPWRMLATRPRASSSHDQPVSSSQLQALLDQAGIAVAIRHVSWSTSVRLQHRLATQFHRGRIFIAGDAAHTHSPAAGQGMNMGIHDATNLGWKLAFAARARNSAPELFRSYGLERRKEDRHVLRMTRLIFWAEASTHPIAQFARGVLAPFGAPFIPWMTRRRRLMGAVGGSLARFGVTYRNSPLSVTGGGSQRRVPRRSPLRARAGSRLPDIPVVCDGESVLLHSLLATPGVHMLLEKHSASVSIGGPHVIVHRIRSWPGNGLVIVRPDGYVGYRSNTVDESEIDRWLRSVALSPP